MDKFKMPEFYTALLQQIGITRKANLSNKENRLISGYKEFPAESPEEKEELKALLQKQNKQSLFELGSHEFKLTFAPNKLEDVGSTKVYMRNKATLEKNILDKNVP